MRVVYCTYLHTSWLQIYRMDQYAILKREERNSLCSEMILLFFRNKNVKQK